MIQKENIKAIIWDWNGTLLDDVVYSVDCINNLLVKRKMPIVTVEKYKEVFTFPVIEYYKRIGFDFEKEEWEHVAMEFMGNYWENMCDIPLFNDAKHVLEYYSSRNIKQYIVSAMEHEKLNSMVANRGVAEYFENILGINDHFAMSKSYLGEQILKETGGNSSDLIWIGDTFHDFEVASRLGIKSVLLTCGHQNVSVLSRANVPLFDSLNALVSNEKPEYKNSYSG